MERRSRCGAIGVCAAIAATLLAGDAGADATVRLAVEWDKLVGLLRGEGAASPGPWRADPDRVISEASRAHAPSLLDGLQGRGRWSLVARDWETARPLLGRLGPTDEVRDGRTKRMVLLRGRLLEGPFTPFAQIGVGQWRIDPDMPAVPHDRVPASQVGFGLEYAVASWVAVAFEADCTLLDPGHLDPTDPLHPVRPGAGIQQRDLQWVHPPALWGAFLAARAQF
jgi:hypothetical protein